MIRIKSAWFRPNIRGILLYLAVLFVGLMFIPSPTFTYLISDGTQSVEWSRWGLAVSFALVVLLYPVCMGLGARMSGQGLGRLLTGPLMIIPQGLVVAAIVGVIYEPPEIHRDLERLIFLQGRR